MRWGIAIFGVVCLAALAPSCGHPDYGDTPFLCGNNGECPDDYTCTNGECVKNGVQPQMQQPDAATTGGSGGHTTGGTGGTSGTGGVGGSSGSGGTSGTGGTSGSGGIGGTGGTSGSGGIGGTGGSSGTGGTGGGAGSGGSCSVNADCAAPLQCCLIFNTCGDPSSNPLCIPSPI